MDDDMLSENEIEAIQAAAEAGGGYLDGIGKTDLATLSPEEWMTLNHKSFMAGVRRLGELEAKGIPF